MAQRRRVFSARLPREIADVFLGLPRAERRSMVESCVAATISAAPPPPPKIAASVTLDPATDAAIRARAAQYHLAPSTFVAIAVTEMIQRGETHVRSGE